MTLRQELEKMGPERVRAGMIAFEHRASHNRGAFEGGPCGGCCFMTHALGVTYGPQYREANKAIAGAGPFLTKVSVAFELGGKVRADLHAECVAYLAEHGVAVEPGVQRLGAVREEVGANAVG